MIFSGGYIRIPRSIESWYHLKDIETYYVYTNLLRKANFTEGVFLGHLEVKRGQLVTSRNHLSEEFGIPVQRIRTILNKLERTGDIEVTPYKRNFTIITILNYDDFEQPKEKEKPTFTPPTYEEAFEIIEIPQEAEKFMNHYASTGWILNNGRYPSSWEALAKKWRANAGITDYQVFAEACNRGCKHERWYREKYGEEHAKKHDGRLAMEAITNSGVFDMY